jgi:hypothetical protein
VRYGADYAYGLLAAGFIDLVPEAGLKPYDFCAMVDRRRAGGVAGSARNGSRLASDGRVLVAGDVRLTRRRSPSRRLSQSREPMMRKAPGTSRPVVVGRGGCLRTQPGMSLFTIGNTVPTSRILITSTAGAEGGTMRLSAIGTFDTLNPYVVGVRRPAQRYSAR